MERYEIWKVVWPDGVETFFCYPQCKLSLMLAAWLVSRGATQVVEMTCPREVAYAFCNFLNGVYNPEEVYVTEKPYIDQWADTCGD